MQVWGDKSRIHALGGSFIIYRILRTIGQYFFSSTCWLRPIVHIDLYKDEVEKSGIPKKKSR